MTNKKPFVKWVPYGIELPLHQNLMHWPSPTAALEQSLGAIWDAASRAVVLILPEIKLNLQLPSCTSFLVYNYCDNEGTQSGLSYFDWTPGGTETMVPAVAPCAPICLLGEWKWIWVSLSWFLNFPYWLRFWILFGSGAGYLSPPSRKDMGGGMKHPGHTHFWSKHWVGLSWKILRNSYPDKRHWIGDWLKGTRWITHPVERYWVGGLNWGEKIKEYPGFSWKMPRSLHCSGLNGIRWVVK